MGTTSYTIGQIAKLCGVPVRKVRFYADEGLLAPGRTEAGYRVFGDKDVVALDLICALRQAGAGLQTIRAVLDGNTPLKDVLEMRLAEVEAHIRIQRRFASALRSALKAPAPTIEDLRKVRQMIELSHSRRRAIVAAFFEEITEGVRFDPKWKEVMIRLGAPELPQDASPAQIDAWLELNELLGDPRLRGILRAQAVDTGRTLNFLRVRDEREAYLARHEAMNLRIREAMERGATPQSPQGQAMADDYIALLAWNRGLPDTPEFRGYIAEMWAHTDTIRRFWELVGILNGRPEAPSPEYRWIEEATTRRLATLQG